MSARQTAEPFVVISRRGEKRVRAGHPWVYRSDVADVQASGGDTVKVLGPRGVPVGHALFSDRSEITIRMVAPNGPPPDREFWRRRVDSAIAYRAQLKIAANAYRLVHGEADLLPSMIVDRYGDYLVVQSQSQGADRLQSTLCDILTERLRPAGILARNDARVRVLEGLEQRVDVVQGQVPDRVVVHEGAVESEVDLRHGQKTGLFLDQRENRHAAATYASGRALDCFSYHGGFALHLARVATEVMALEISDAAVDEIRKNATRNGLTNIEARAVNVFDALRELERSGERFDTIVLDPPAFAKHKSAIPKAISGYREINLRALKLLAPGGYLVSCSCSYHVDEALLGQIIHEAAVDAHARVMVVEKRMQARDHPVLLGVPETHYLKCFILRKTGP